MTQAYNDEPQLLSIKQLDSSLFNSPNVSKPNGNQVKQQLQQNQQPLGSQFRSYELNKASNYWTLDPFQYSITRFDFNTPSDGLNKVRAGKNDFENDPGLVYKDVDFEQLLPAYTSTKRSVNDFPAQSYHRFQANEGYFNPNESNDNHDLWYYGADEIAKRNNQVAGAALNVQEVKHIIFPEPQRGGLDSRNLAKYSWTSTPPARDNESWGSQNKQPVDNSINCDFFNYNSGYKIPAHTDVDKVYQFDSDYCRNIAIASPNNGSMPYNPENVK
jgi:hypothetical protein